MEEIFEFRLSEKEAKSFLRSNEGKEVHEGVRLVSVHPSDKQLMQKLQLAHDNQKKVGRSLLFSWNVTRKYSTNEISKARVFKVKIKSVFDPAGEETGTVYDEPSACSLCGTGATQTSSLRIRVSAIPKKKDFARTITDEIVFSSRAVGVFRGAGIKGVEFDPVYNGVKTKVADERWYQPRFVSEPVEILPPTALGISPLDIDAAGKYQCVKGHYIGLNVISELTISEKDFCTADFAVTKQFVGIREGMLRPQRLILISAKARHLVIAERLSGLDFEVSYLA